MQNLRRLARALSFIIVANATMYGSTLLVATLTNAQEVPLPTLTNSATGAPRPASFGNASFVLNDAMTAMTMMVTVFNIDFTGSQTPTDTNDDIRNAHIHASATVLPTGTAGVVWGFIGTPFNDNNPMDVVVTPFATGVGATITAKWDAPEGNGTTLTAQLPNILSGHSYINFHTAQNPGGEIRGFLQVVPEPSSMVLLGAGVLAFVGYARRRSRDAARE